MNNESRITNNSPPRPGGEEEINLLDYWRVICKYRWMILGIMMIAALATGILSLRIWSRQSGMRLDARIYLLAMAFYLDIITRNENHWQTTAYA